MKMYSLSKKLLLAAGLSAIATACSSNQSAPQQTSQANSAPMPPASCGKKDDCAPCAKPQCEQKPKQECTPTKPAEKPCEPCKKSCEGTETEKPSAPTASAPAAPTAQPAAPTALDQAPAATTEKNPVSENSSVEAPVVSEKSVVDNSATAPVTP